MAGAIVNKLLHGPSTRLRRAAAEDDGRLIDAALELFTPPETHRGAPVAVAAVPQDDAPAEAPKEAVAPEAGAPPHAAQAGAVGRLKH